jgi:spermidine synthase
LLYEVSWIREASLVFGSSTLAVSTVLAVFFLGLAIGSELAGRLSVRVSQPLLVCAFVELGIGLLALASPLLFALAEHAYGEAYRSLGERVGWLLAVRVALTAMVLLPVTTLMGATLPLFCRQLTREPSRVAAMVGTLYAVNTIGGAVGCAATGLWLIPTLGVTASIRLGALTSGLAAALAWMAGAAATEVPAVAAAPAANRKESRPRSPSAAIGALLFLIGFGALANEVLWTRYLGLLIQSTIHTYTLTLTVVLSGIVLGSALAARLFDGRLGNAVTFGWLQCLNGVLVLTLMLLPAAAWKALGTQLPILFALILPPSVLAGASFPLAIRLVIHDLGNVGGHVGRMTALNVLGGITGSLVTGFLWLPRLGLQVSVLLVTGMSVAVGIAACLLGGRPGARVRPALAALGAGIVWFTVPRVLPTRVPDDFLREGGVLLDVREGLTSTVSVLRIDGIRQLKMDLWWQGQNSRNHQLVAAHLPMLLHPDPRRVMVVGVGTGQTAARFLLYDIERLDCVDIEPAVFDVIRKHFDAAWMDDPRVRLLREDGRNVVVHTDERYDVISLELGQLFRPGVESFYTRDFYARVAERLRPGGVVGQFVPLPFLDVEQLRSLVRSFLDVFPESVLWYNTSELLLIGSRDAPLALREGRLRLLAADARIRDDLHYSHWDGADYWLSQPVVLAAGFLSGPRGLAALAGDAPPFRDDRPVLEYAAEAMLARDPPELTSVSVLRRYLDPPETVLERGAEPALAREAVTIREMNLADLVAAARLRQIEPLKARGDYTAIAGLLTQVIALQPHQATARRMFADALVYLGRLDEARSAYARALAVRPDDALAHRGFGAVLLMAGDAAASVPHLRAALDLRPEDAEAHNNLGIGLARLGDLDDATRHFEQALALRPGYFDAERNLERLRAAGRGTQP